MNDMGIFGKQKTVHYMLANSVQAACPVSNAGMYCITFWLMTGCRCDGAPIRL
jgi:hypothetical protein